MALSFFLFFGLEEFVVIILKYGSYKKMLKNDSRRKHTCSKCGCEVMLEEDVIVGGIHTSARIVIKMSRLKFMIGLE